MRAPLRMSQTFSLGTEEMAVPLPWTGETGRSRQFGGRDGKSIKIKQNKIKNYSAFQRGRTIQESFQTLRCPWDVHALRARGLTL